MSNQESQKLQAFDSNLFSYMFCVIMAACVYGSDQATWENKFVNLRGCLLNYLCNSNHIQSTVLSIVNFVYSIAVIKDSKLQSPEIKAILEKIIDAENRLGSGHAKQHL